MVRRKHPWTLGHCETLRGVRVELGSYQIATNICHESRVNKRREKTRSIDRSEFRQTARNRSVRDPLKHPVWKSRFNFSILPFRSENTCDREESDLAVVVFFFFKEQLENKYFQLHSAKRLSPSKVLYNEIDIFNQVIRLIRALKYFLAISGQEAESVWKGSKGVWKVTSGNCGRTSAEKRTIKRD